MDLTPNPNALKFILNKKLTNGAANNFASKKEAQNNPVAKGIFEINGVVSVFYTENFITVEKEPAASWQNIQLQIIRFIGSFDESELPAEISEGESLEEERKSSALNKINGILDKRIRPLLATDGGGLKVISFEKNTLRIKYEGACGSCPFAIIGTLKTIEQLLQREFDPNIKVLAV